MVRVVQRDKRLADDLADEQSAEDQHRAENAHDVEPRVTGDFRLRFGRMFQNTSTMCMNTIQQHMTNTSPALRRERGSSTRNGTMKWPIGSRKNQRGPRRGAS